MRSSESEVISGRVGSPLTQTRDLPPHPVTMDYGRGPSRLSARRVRRVTVTSDNCWTAGPPAAPGPSPPRKRGVYRSLLAESANDSAASHFMMGEWVGASLHYNLVVLINTGCIFVFLFLKFLFSTGESHNTKGLCAEAVEGLPLALEGVDHVEGGHGLAAGVLSVGHGVTDDVLKEDLEDTAGLLVDEAADALHTTTASEAADGGLGDALDVVTKNLSVTLGAALAQTLTTLATARHWGGREGERGGEGRRERGAWGERSSWEVRGAKNEVQSLG